MSGFTQEQLTALEKAIAKGVRSVSYDGQTVTYATTAEMLKLRDTIRRALGVKVGPGRRYAVLNR